MAKKRNIQNKQEQFWNYKLILVLAITGIAYYPSLNNGFLNWDDIIYVMNNDMIKTLSVENVTKMFSTFYMGNYHPFIIFSFAFDYSLFQLNPTGYHVHNLVIHLINSFLVYAFCYFLFSKKTNIALIVSVLFALHPMHVESVAWISERKDLLYTMYFMMSLISYLFYIEKKEIKYFVLSVCLFVFSLLSKAQAVTLPVVLVLIDFFLSRKITRKTILEKIPFFTLSLIFGIVAIYAQKADNSINPNGISVFNSLFYAQYSIWVYLYKLVLPINQTCLYEYPINQVGKPPLYIYFSPFIIPLIGYLIFKAWKKWNTGTFSVLFFLATIFPVLQFLPVGQAIVAERYTYIPYIGLFILAGSLFLMLRDKAGKSSTKLLYSYAGLVIIALLSLTTYHRTKVWYDSVSLWTDVIEKNPKSVTAYVNRGYMYNQYKEYDKAIRDCNEGLSIDSNYFKFYVNRAVSYRNTGRYDMAFADFSKALLKNPKDYNTYLDRGILYTDQFMKYDLGIADFKVYLKYRPDNVDGYYNMAVAHFKKQSFDTAIDYCNQAIQISSEIAGPYYIKALISDARGDFNNAFLFGSKAKQLGYAFEDTQLKIWQQKAGIPDVSIGH
jgi:tetratricopeptide (TPR) repeat protein